MTRRWFERCPCGHSWLFHDKGEADADDDLCCVEGCDQQACPGRQPMPPVSEAREIDARKLGEGVR